MAYDKAAFQALQSRLADLWPVLTMRTIADRPRVVVVVSSMTVDVPQQIQPMVPAYEERYLCLVLALARSEHTRVIYVTSLPMLPRLADYYLDLVKGVDVSSLRSRLTVVSVGDPSPRPLTHKLLARPRLLARLRRLIGDPRYGLLMPFVVTEAEAELALALRIPVYGPDPALSFLGTKTGSRQVFAAAGVPMPRGSGGLRDRGDIVDALLMIQRVRPVARAAIKLDSGFSGLGNAVVDLGFVQERRALANAVDHLLPEGQGHTAESFLAAFAEQGGVAEEWLDGDEVASPSVQLRASPLSEVEVLSTHDQILGGPRGQSYLGCRFPAAAPFVDALTHHGHTVGQELSGRGVIGRFAVDFVCARLGTQWLHHAVEINLRNGGTTHPAVTLSALTDGSYHEASGRFLASTGSKCYVATDHLDDAAYTRLTPDDVLDVIGEPGLGWDPSTETGVALHMVSGVSAGGNLGATAIGGTAEQADEFMLRLRQALDAASDTG